MGSRIFIVIITYLLLTTNILFVSCMPICKVLPIEKKVTNTTVSFNDSKIPCIKVKDYSVAVESFIKVLFSDTFEHALNDHIVNKIGIGPHAKAWEGHLLMK